MSRGNLRWVYYDNASPQITYSGDWAEDTSLYRPGAGFILGSSQQRAVGNASMSLEFDGTIMVVVGRMQSTTRGGQNVSGGWECTVDGTSIPAHLPTFVAQINNYPLCDTGDLPLTTGHHVLEISVQAEETLPVWIDRVMVWPIANAAYANHGSRLSPLDNAFTYETGRWNTIPNTTIRYTNQAGTSLSVFFNGTRVSWVSDSLINLRLPFGVSRGVYTIDDLAPVPFEIPGVPPNSVDPRQQLLFESDILPYGPHRLTVTYLGASAPLVLDSVFVDRGDVLAPDGGDFPRYTSHSKSQSLPSNVGGIVGGVLGGLIFLAALLLACYFLFFKERKRKQGNQKVYPRHSDILKERASLDAELPVASTPNGYLLSQPPQIEPEFTGLGYDYASLDLSSLQTKPGETETSGTVELGKMQMDVVEEPLPSASIAEASTTVHVPATVSDPPDPAPETLKPSMTETPPKVKRQRPLPTSPIQAGASTVAQTTLQSTPAKTPRRPLPATPGSQGSPFRA
ncbi:hypothetical protein FA15DRAFT_203892 [Coprinopsis marcescibilis]|uniref:Uncharacterized protein n=1 Tax=Coprinopsis marcescibilis TaxID=230819 RepID=A0A5C3LAZ6_COPMA|nr:hypothetical protein FA15DRAFT_203892 [Coprinopsis marcescibilis]